MNKAIVTWDNLTSSDETYCDRVRDITKFYGHVPAGYRKLTTKNLTESLVMLQKQKVRWAFVHAMGHWVSNHPLYERLIVQCEQEQIPLMAHIIFRPGSYPNIDEQFFLLDLQVWADVGSPQLEQQSGPCTLDTVTIQRSEENHHDDYTPYWIKPSTGQQQFKSYAKLFGMELIKRLMESGYTVSNFDQHARTFKTYLYPNSNQSELSKFFKDGTVAWDLPPEFANIVTNELSTLDQTVYLLNSEFVYYPPKPYGPVDHLIGVAAGFKSVLLLHILGFSDHATVSYIDISEPALEYQRYLIDEWNGDLGFYGEVSERFQRKNPHYRYAWKSWNKWDDEIDALLAGPNISKQEFQKLWQRYLRLNHRFYPIDLIQEYHKLFDVATSVEARKTYIWLSNALNMQWLIFLHGKDIGQEITDYIKQKLNESQVDYCLESLGYFSYAKS